MKALGAKLIEYGNDFQESREFAAQYAQDHQAHMIPSFHPLLLQGVATYALELFTHVSDLEYIYVPIGLGSGICSVIAVRNIISPKTKVIGVVSSHAPAYALSFHAKKSLKHLSIPS